MSRDLDVRLRRAQEEIADLGKELLEVHQGMETLLRLLETGAPGSVPAPLVLEERLAHLEARFRRLEEIAERTAGGRRSLLSEAAAKGYRTARAAAKRVARRAWRLLKLRRGPAIPPAEWVFETRLLRRPHVSSPAVTVLVPREIEGEVRDWLARQTLRDVDVLVATSTSQRVEGAEGPRGRWVFLAPHAPAPARPTFLEEHLWVAAAEDLAFTAEGEGPDARAVFAAGRFLDAQRTSLRLPAVESPAEGRRVVGRTIPGSPGAGGTAIAVPPSVVSVGGLWVRREAWISGLPLERALTPLDGVFTTDEASSLPEETAVVALVGSRSGWGGTVFARRLAETLAPGRAMVLFDTDEAKPIDGMAAYSAGALLPAPLRLSALELVARRRGTRTVLDLRWRPDPLHLARSLQLRNPEIAVVGVSAEGLGEGLGLPCLPPEGALAPFSAEVRAGARARLGIPEGNVAVVLADTLDEDSGVFELLQAASLLEGQGGWTFLVGGDGPLRPVVSGLVETRGLAAIRVATEGLDDLLAAADVLCLPGTGPFRTQLLLEALARGVPAVAAEPTAVALGVQDAVGLVGERADGTTLAAALVPLASASAREELSRRGLAAAEAWSDRNRPAERWKERLGGSGDSRP